MEKAFYACGDKGLEEINQVLSSGGTVKTVVVASGRDDRNSEAYIVVELPPSSNQ